MASVQENGFKTIKQSYGTQSFGVTLDGVQTAKISGSNITAVDGVVRLYSSPFIGFGPQHPFDPNVPQGMYTYEGMIQLNAYTGGEELLYNHNVASFDVNPFNAILRENLGDFVITVDEVRAYGVGQNANSYNTIALSIGSTRNFPTVQTLQTPQVSLYSYKNIFFTQRDLVAIQVKADEGDIKIRVVDVSPVGVPAETDNIVYVKYKLTARKINNL